MNLAYSAYMPLTRAFSGLAPGLFMEDNIVSAEDLLDDYGIKSVAFNTDKKDTVCHIIGHKQIYVDINYNTSGNTNGGNNNGYLGILEGTGRCKPIGVFSGSNQSGLRTDVSMDSTGMSCVGSSEAFWNTLNSNGANNTDCMRTLVVVDIRGSSTNKDWITDFGTQLDPNWGSFGAGMEMVLKSLYHGTGDTENCTKCNGGGCEHCKGYIPYNNISNPIFLVTGHSLGAAVANLLAEHLNSCKDTNHCPGSRTEKDIYSYTFATPKTVKNKQGSDSQNIFNILNNNDIVPLVPTNILALNWADNGWTRHGRDFRITMPMDVDLWWLKPFDTALLGFGGHAMSTYSHWLEKLSGMLNKKAEDITTEDLKSISDDRDAVGLLPRLFKVKCPVDVILKDSDGNIIARLSHIDGGQNEKIKKTKNC